MLCEMCQQKEATVHLTATVHATDVGQEQGTQQQRHFCERCADEHFASTPGLGILRNLIDRDDCSSTKV
jgi:protein-arginine kinase activator protein McsA